MGAEELKDDEATPSLARAPPTGLGFATPPSKGLIYEEIATLAHRLTQVIVAARSNPAITPPPKYAAVSNPIPYPPYEEDKTEKRPCATRHGEARHRTCSGKDRLGPRIFSAKQRLGSRKHITDSQAQHISHAKISSFLEREAQSSLKSYILVE